MDTVVSNLIKKHKTNDPFVIAKNLNITIMFENLGETTRGFYCRKLRRRYICIHHDLSDEWKRFVCAHELAHDRLHKGVSRFCIDENSFFSPGKFERQANEFAVLLLMKNEKLEQEESVYDFLKRNNIPVEMAEYLKSYNNALIK